MNIPAPSLTGSQVLDDIAEVIGEEGAFAFAAEFRGERVYLPKDPEREPRIAAAIGSERARQLCDAFHGTVVTIPIRAVLERQVVDLAGRPGMTKREIARRLNIREARVYAILARIRDERQPDLFEQRSLLRRRI